MAELREETKSFLSAAQGSADTKSDSQSGKGIPKAI